MMVVEEHERPEPKRVAADKQMTVDTRARTRLCTCTFILSPHRLPLPPSRSSPSPFFPPLATQDVHRHDPRTCLPSSSVVARGLMTEDTNNWQNVEFLNNPARFLDPYHFRVTFECVAPLPEGTYQPYFFCFLPQTSSRTFRSGMAPHLRRVPGQRRARPSARRLSSRARPRLR